MDFDGTDDIIDAGTNTITGSDPFSMGAWFKVGTHSTYGLAVFMGTASTDNSAWIGWAGSTIGGGFYGRNYGSGISDSNWHYVTLTFSGGTGGTAKLYVDGELKITDTNYTPSIGSGKVFMGDASTGSDYYYDGQIDEVKIFNYALTPEDIKKEYNGGFSTFFR